MAQSNMPLYFFLQCQNYCFGFARAIRTFKASWGISGELGETVKLLGSLISLCTVLISLFVYRPVNQFPLSLPASHVPLSIHPSHSLFFMLASWSGHRWLQKLPDSQARPPQALPGMIIFVFDTFNLRQ